MTELTPEEIQDAAIQVVDDHLDADLDHLVVAEVLNDIYPDADPDDLAAVHVAATLLLRTVRSKF